MPETTNGTSEAPVDVAPDSDDSAATVTANRTGERSGAILRKLLPIAVILVVCSAAVVLHVSQYRHLGPLDEQAHLDYVNRLRSGHFPAIGQKITTETRRQVACRGLESPVGFGDIPDCSSFRTKEMPERANSYEAGQPPLYYAVTAAVSKILPGDDVDSIRRVGALWLAVGAIALYLTLRRLKVGELFAVVVSLALALAPQLLMAASVVSNDIAVWTFGAVGLWAVVVLMQAPQPRYPQLLIGGLVGVAAALIKPSALLIVIAFAAVVILQQWWTGRLKWGLLLGASMLGGAVVATGVWGLVVTSLQHVPLNHIQPWSRYRVSSLDPVELFKQPLFKLVSPLRAFIPAEWRGNWLLQDLIEIAIYVEIALLLLPLLVKWPADRIGRSIGLTYLAVVAIAGPYYVAVYFVATRILYGADFRFAFGLIPLMAVVLVTWVSHQWQRWVLTAALGAPALLYLALLVGV